MTTPRKEISVSRSAQNPQFGVFGEMERMFEDMLSGRWLQPFGWQHPIGGLARMPSLDVIDRENEVLVRAEVPGYKKEDIEISVGDGSITIQGESKSEKKDEAQDYYRCEIAHGAFSRTVALPAAVDESKATASMRDGMLELKLPKVEKSKRQTIAIS